MVCSFKLQLLQRVKKGTREKIKPYLLMFSGDNINASMSVLFRCMYASAYA